LGGTVGIELARRRGGWSGADARIIRVSFGGGIWRSRGQAKTVFQALDLASHVRRVLVGLAADISTGLAYVTHESAIFDASGRAHEREHALVLQARRRGGETRDLVAGSDGQRQLAGRGTFDVLQKICDFMSERWLQRPAWFGRLADDGLGASREVWAEFRQL
jgi:hypothetical protein